MALVFSAPVADGGNQQLMWVPVRCFMKGTGPVTTRWLMKSLLDDLNIAHEALLFVEKTSASQLWENYY